MRILAIAVLLLASCGDDLRAGVDAAGPDAGPTCVSLGCPIASACRRDGTCWCAVPDAGEVRCEREATR